MLQVCVLCRCQSILPISISSSPVGRLVAGRRQRENAVETARSVPQVLIAQVRVAVRHARVAVPQQLLQVVKIGPVHAKVGRVRVSQIAKRKVSNARFLARAHEGDCDLRGRHVGKHEAAVLPLRARPHCARLHLWRTMRRQGDASP